MTSTTANKKAIVDFLWEWTESHGDWSKLLISKIVTTENNLSIDDRKEIFNYFLQSLELHTGLPELNIIKPTYTPTSKEIELKSLSDITGVNKLAKNQTIEFAKNITIIYGENGTGKTGYSRILKTLGFSYDTNNKILTNIFRNEEELQSATIIYKSNNVDKSFTWNGINKDAELENISVFNNNCVQISLADRQLIVSPIGFHLFNLVSIELNELTNLLNSKISSHQTNIIWKENLNNGTPQQNFILTLSELSTEEKLIELSEFNPEHEKILNQKQEELANLNKVLLQTEIQNLRASISELDTIIYKIQVAQDQFKSATWETIINYNKQIADLESKTKKGIKEIAEQNGIEFYETDEFKSFIKSAEDYIKRIDKPDYPSENDTCIYCLQTLNSSAKELLKNYRLLLNDKTQESLSKLRNLKSGLISQVSNIDTNIVFHHPTFGMAEDEKPVQPSEIITFNKDLGQLKLIFTTNNNPDNTVFNFDYSKYLTFLTNKRDEINLVLTKKNEALLNITEKEGELKKVISELKDRKLLSTKAAEIKLIISNYKITSKLSSYYNSFNTTSISRKTTAAREELVSQDFKDIFNKELRALRKSNLNIELSFGTDRGSSKIYQKISRHALLEILSEGEQKAIALAEFLTELQLDNIKAPVVFDDPVNSLDHKIIDEVAKRLIELSKQRQVIIFTHSILLLHSLIQQSELEHNKQAGIESKFSKVKDNFGTTGILDEVEEINSYSYYTKKLNVVLQTNPAGQDESKLAAEGYGHLRSAIEITVEDNLFQKTIKRYKKGVAFPSLLRIEGTKIDEHKGKLNDIYEKCCVSIAGHSSPEEIPSTPKMDELKADFDEFKKIRANFT